jgi:hypothetical protein
MKLKFICRVLFIFPIFLLTFGQDWEDNTFEDFSKGYFTLRERCL